MKCFLTSSPFLPDRSSINPANGFADRIRASVSSPCKALFICSDPDSHEQTDGLRRRSERTWKRWVCSLVNMPCWMAEMRTRRASLLAARS